MGGGEFIVGITISFVGTTICNYGMNLQKYSFYIVEQNPEAGGRKQKCYWALGFACFVFGQIGILASLGFVDQATAAIFSNVALISNSLFARYFFNEVFTKRDFAAMAFILIGSVLVVLFFAHEEQNFTIETVAMYMQEPLFIIFMMLLAGLFALCVFFCKCWKGMMKKEAFAGLIFASMAALVGCCSLTFGKMFMQMLKESTKGNNQFGHVLTWVVSLIFLFCATLNVFLINMGLANSPAMVMIPIYYVLNTLFATVAGILCFQDFKTFENALNSFLFVIGALGSLVGVVLLSQKEAAAEEEGVFAVSGTAILSIDVLKELMFKNAFTEGLAKQYGVAGTSVTITKISLQDATPARRHSSHIVAYTVDATSSENANALAATNICRNSLVASTQASYKGDSGDIQSMNVESHRRASVTGGDISEDADIISTNSLSTPGRTRGNSTVGSASRLPTQRRLSVVGAVSMNFTVTDVSPTSAAHFRRPSNASPRARLFLPPVNSSIVPCADDTADGGASNGTDGDGDNLLQGPTLNTPTD
jgi:drug/metabolite transporter (DMT)-like permease